MNLLILVAMLCALLCGASPAWACGKAGQRACCVTERGNACDSGTVEVPQANAGKCGGSNPFGVQASSRCVAKTPCGGPNQRACCVGEGKNCHSRLMERAQRAAGYCSNASNGTMSSGICVAPDCGGLNQRACCVGEGPDAGGCKAGLFEQDRVNAGACGNNPGLQAIGVCLPNCGGTNQRACCAAESSKTCLAGLELDGAASGGTCSDGNRSPGTCRAPPCGELGQRACCLNEGSTGRCGRGLMEKVQRNSGYCGNYNAQVPANTMSFPQSNGVCVEAPEDCGDFGQRACCVGEAGFGACMPGLFEKEQANAGQCGNSGAHSNGICEIGCGGDKQRACCPGETDFSCRPGHRVEQVSGSPHPSTVQCTSRSTLDFINYYCVKI